MRKLAVFALMATLLMLGCSKSVSYYQQGQPIPLWSLTENSTVAQCSEDGKTYHDCSDAELRQIIRQLIDEHN